MDTAGNYELKLVQWALLYFSDLSLLKAEASLCCEQLAILAIRTHDL